jgi:hypothetical protein
MQSLLAAVVRGAQPEWPAPNADAHMAQQFVQEAVRHGVLPLVAWQFASRGAPPGWPSDLVDAIRSRARQHALAEQLQRLELADLGSDLHNRGVRALFFKGAALAYTHYVHPCHRPRTDVDLLVPEPHVEPAIATLRSRGYSPIAMNTGSLVTYQQTFIRADGSGVRHACDVHWRIANRPAFARLLCFDELYADARTLPGLGENVAAPSPPYALLIACIHRVAHHHDAPTLIWAYDVHLLASRMTEREAAETRMLMEKKGLATIGAAALALSRDLFETNVPGPL